ncbi:MAG: glycosyltransferase family 2 protein [Bergeyella cardium]
MKEPLVSVVTITYGHEKYIGETINGVFSQKTNFPIEFIIANDCSPDNSDKIIRELIQNAPEHITIKYTRHTENKGMIRNSVWAMSQARGKYIALCEGDDYWTDENKLQKQVDFLENNNDFAICCHNVKFLDGDTFTSEDYDHLNSKSEYTLEELSQVNLLPTLSAVFRNIKIDFPDWYYDAPMGDYPLMMWIARYGKIKYFSEKMGVYRLNVGVWQHNKNNYENILLLYKHLENDFEENDIVRKNMIQYKRKYIKAHLKTLLIFQIIRNKYLKELSFYERLKLIVKKIFSTSRN